MKKIAILGSTGSIGTQTLEVVRANGDIQVLGISAGRNIKKLEEQAREFCPRLVAVWEEDAARELRVKLQDTDVKVVSGMEGLLELASMEETEILVTAIVGMLGIRPTIEAIRAGKDIALANKETLVTAGHLIMPMAEKYGVKILPVDSEHSAVFQCLNGERREEIHKLLITASGGPFRGRKRKDLEQVTLADTLKHPNWVMGQKITVDSSTLVNKGLEVMEAKWLFDVELDRIQVVVQPQSVIHSMVEFKDGVLWRSWERRICVCLFSMLFIIRKEDTWTVRDLILQSLGRLPLKSLIWRLFWDFQWQFRQPGRAVPCRLFLMRQTSLQ